MQYMGISSCCFLILCGDVSLNPGPTRYPCTVCDKPVRSNQRSLQCDNCQLWSHADCTGVSGALYAELQSQTEFFYGSILLALTIDVLHDSFVGIRVVHHNILGLHSKIDD